MALLTAAQFKASREAIAAGVNTVTDAEADAALRKAEAALNQFLGYRVAPADTLVTVRVSGGEVFYLPERARTVTEVTSDGVVVEAANYFVIGGGFALERSIPWRGEIAIEGTFGLDPAEDSYLLAQEAVKLMAVDYLRSTQVPKGFPTMAGGAYLTGYSSENASFTFFTPNGELGNPEVDRLSRLIGRHPLKGDHIIQAVALGSTAYGNVE